jgi:uncharacterized protein (TIGR02594 family)
MSDQFQPAWLSHAWDQLGVLEGPGDSNNPRILDLYRDAGHPEIRNDTVAWCAAFVGACLQRAGTRNTDSLLARSYLRWGEAIATPRFGAIAVFSRGTNPTHGHVGFVVGATAIDIILLGGNQSDAVTVEAISRDRLLSLRWPTDPSSSTPTLPSPVPSADLFQLALEHVLEMEGGYTDDPHDPGGPTNLGITLATFAAWRSITVSVDTFGALKADLRTLNRNTAADIYRARYWARSRAVDLPPALALMHFDAAVNHGVTGAARMLQQACGVESDGEIGPDTLAATHTIALPSLVAAYADIRIARYRALPHFWRFGRGWLRRVEATRAASATLYSTPSTTRQDQPMTSPSLPTDISPKWWGNSLTIWGTIITALSTVLPVVGPLIGIDITAEMVRDIGQGLTTLIQALGGVIGTVLAIYGRTRAVQPLSRRPVALRL